MRAAFGSRSRADPPRRCVPLAAGSMFWQLVAWFASILAGPTSELAGELLNLTGFANHRHGKSVFGGLVDLGLQGRRHLQQVGAFAGDLPPARFFSQPRLAAGPAARQWKLVRIHFPEGSTQAAETPFAHGCAAFPRQPPRPAQQRLPLRKAILAGPIPGTRTLPPCRARLVSSTSPHPPDSAGRVDRGSGRSCAQSSLVIGVWACFFLP